MKKNSKILSLVLAVILSAVMLVTASGLEIFIIASSEDYESYATSAKYLEILDILKGYDDGELHLDEPILRYQAALLFARVMTGVVDDTQWGTGASSQYTDVPEYGPIMDLISSLGVIRGYGNGLFGYNDGIRYQDMCAMFVRVLGYETEDMPASYPMSYVLKVEKLGFALNNVLPGDYLNRGQVAQMIYDVLDTEIAETNDEKHLLIAEILKKKREEEGESGTNTEIDETKDTYLERNFNVSSEMQFMIIATENYVLIDGVHKAEKGYFNALYGSEIWSFPIDGEATKDVTEADLVGKIINVVFDDKTPTADELEKEEISIVHVDMLKADTYENKGELSYVKIDEAGENVYLGSKKVNIAEYAASSVVLYPSEDTTAVYNALLLDDEQVSVKELLESHTYFKIDAYDSDKDGEYDLIIYTPYEFGQFAKRRYSNKTYTMVGKYSDSFVYDITSTSEKTDENKTHFIEYFLGGTDTATSLGAYRPGNTDIAVGDEGKYSLNANVTGVPAATGDFILYSYNIHTGEFCIVENLGKFQTGELTGYSTKSETVTIDGSVMSLGLPGKLVNADGLLTGEGAFALKQPLIATIFRQHEKGEENAKYIEYDTKLIYLEAYGAAAETDTGDYFVVDIEASLEAALEADEDAFDLIFDDNSVTVKQLDLATGNLTTAKVELIKAASVTVECDNIKMKRAFSNWPDNKAYNAIKNAGTIFLAEDEDKDGLLELYAFGTEEFSTVAGASVAAVADGEPSVYYTYNRSNYFIDETNDGGFTTDRITASSSTVSIVIGADGYAVVKGAMGTNSVERPNELYLSTAARVIAASDSQLIIFDPMGTVTLGTENNVYDNDAASIWNAGETKEESGAKYYILLNTSKYIESCIWEDEDGSPMKNEDGDILYEHRYEKLYNLIDNTSEDVTVITTDIDPVFDGVANRIKGVLRVDADEYKATAVHFEEVFVENGIYRNATLDNFFAKDRLTANIEGKDEDGNGILTGDEKGRVVKYDKESDSIYDSLESLSYMFIDLDGGVDVDPEKYCFEDAYLFYHANTSNKKNYASVTLEDRELIDATIAIRRHMHSGKDLLDQIDNGAITHDLTEGVSGKIYGQTYFARNGWCDYLIPAVDEDGQTIWKYEGSLRVRVTYLSFAYYSEENNSLIAVVVRIGIPDEVVESGDSLPDISDMPVDTEE